MASLAGSVLLTPSNFRSGSRLGALGGRSTVSHREVDVLKCRTSGEQYLVSSRRGKFVPRQAMETSIYAIPTVNPSAGSDSKGISKLFEKLRLDGKVALIPYVTAGDPDLRTTGEAIKLLDKLDSTVIELGIPYSDPLADGPVIQAAASRSLRQGTTVDSVFELIREVSPQIKAPIVVFIYYNQLLRRGLENFVKEARSAGVSGMVVPDLPLEETEKLRDLTLANGLELVLLTTPTTPIERMISIAEASQGFIYMVSLTGVTGARTTVESRVEKLLKSLKSVTEKPVCVGFGISSGVQARQIAGWGADGVIIGSAVVKLLGESGSPEQGLRAVEDFIVGVQQHLTARYQ